MKTFAGQLLSAQFELNIDAETTSLEEAKKRAAQKFQA